MPSTIAFEPNNICVLTISGTWTRSEFEEAEKALARQIESGGRPRMLVVSDNFKGWEKGADWSDLDFMFSHGEKIDKIAIVGEPGWEADALAFAGSGFRRAPVKFFPPNDQVRARAWLAE